MAGEFEEYLREHGVRHQLTARYTSPQNGVAEQKNRIIKEHVRCILKTEKSPSYSWAEAVASAAYLLIVQQQAVFQGRPLNSNKLCLSQFRIFCYNKNSKAYNPTTKLLIAIRDVIFDEEGAWD